MKFTVSQQSLNAALDLVARIATEKSPSPILANLLIQAESINNQLTISATNLSVDVRATVQAQVEISGLVTVPAKILAEWVSLVSGEINAEFSKASKGKLLLAAGKSKLNLSTIDAQEFPDLQHAGTLTLWGTIDAADLRVGLRSTLFSIMDDPTRGALASLHMRIPSSNSLVLAGLDGFRVSKKHLTIETNGLPEGGLSALLPRQSTVELERFLARATGQVTIRSNSNHMVVETDSAYFGSLLMSEDPIPYDSFFDAFKQHSQANILVSDLLSSIKKVGVATGPEFPYIKIVMDPEGGNSLLVATFDNGSEKGSGTDYVPVESANGQINSKYNLGYLLGLLGAFPERTMIVRAGSMNDSEFLKFSDPEETFHHIISPYAID